MSFRVANGDASNAIYGVGAYLDISIHANRNSHLNKCELFFWSAGSNFAAVAMFHSTGNYYGGLVFQYSGENRRFWYNPDGFFLANY